VDFFERQRAARGTSARLVALFVLAVVSIVAINDGVALLLWHNEPTPSLIGIVVAISVITLLIIAGGTASKMIALRGGGAAVAQSVGATAVDPATTDPRLRRFANVVEEMSIASGVPVPRLFVLEQEPGINAFAAGYTPADAAVTVTSGALDRLNRDELQGVIGHEFSHVLNGDMRLNVRLIGLLNGILLLGLVGLRFLQFGGGRSRDSKNGNPILLIALVMIVLGFVGQFFAGLIKAAVSRQREWLADASSVQFTRQTTGLVGALKKIAGLPDGSKLSDAHGEKQINHMLFGEGRPNLAGLYATHPPLPERIAALDPTFRPEQIAELRLQYAQRSPDGLAEDAALGLAATYDHGSAGASVAVEPKAVADRVGTIAVAAGTQLNARIPDGYRQLASQGSTAFDLVLRLLRDEVGDLDPMLRLPLAQLAAPQLAARPPADRRALIAKLDEIARADGTITVAEYCLIRVIGTYLRDVDAPRARSRPGRASVQAVQDAAFTLLAAVSAAGNADPAAAQHAFTAAVAHLLPGTSVPYAPPAEPWRALDAGWDVLDTLDPRNKRVLVEALVIAVSDDGTLTVAEAELLRTTCTLLHCPLPPLLT
jgi:Zn-dependent protease with chaperone function